MNLIIKTGFERIKCSINFQPETIPKGKKLVEANHIFNVEEQRANGHIIIKAKTIRQTSVTSKPYNVQLNIDSNREVKSVSCNCVYNKSNKCKHVAALIFYVNNESSLSKTDFEQQWGKPTSFQLAKEKYSKGKDFYEMFPCPSKKEKLEPHPLHVSELKDRSALKLIIECTTVKTALPLKDTKDTLRKQDCKVCLDNLFIFVEENEIYKGNYIFKDELLKKFYSSEIAMTKEEIIKLCCDTLEQSKCRNWFCARQCRISASSNAHKIKSRKKKSIECLVSDMLSPKNINTSALQYGIKNECNARECYKRLFKCEVVEVGVLISERQPWLCASFDGVVVEDGCITKLLEIKCPISCSNQPIVNFDKQLCNVTYLKFQNDGIVLNSSSPYYSQIQKMYVSGLSICDLFIYSPVENGSYSVQVNRDNDFLKNIILSCEQFYFEHFLPALYIKKNQGPARADNQNNLATVRARHRTRLGDSPSSLALSRSRSCPLSSAEEAPPPPPARRYPRSPPVRAGKRERSSVCVCVRVHTCAYVRARSSSSSSSSESRSRSRDRAAAVGSVETAVSTVPHVERAVRRGLYYIIHSLLPVVPARVRLYAHRRCLVRASLADFHLGPGRVLVAHRRWTEAEGRPSAERAGERARTKVLAERERERERGRGRETRTQDEARKLEGIFQKHNGVLAERGAARADPSAEIRQRQLRAPIELQRAAHPAGSQAGLAGGRQGHRGAAPGPPGEALIANVFDSFGEDARWCENRAERGRAQNDGRLGDCDRGWIEFEREREERERDRMENVRREFSTYRKNCAM